MLFLITLMKNTNGKIKKMSNKVPTKYNLLPVNNTYQDHSSTHTRKKCLHT